MDGPLKNQVLDLCASSASFLEKKTQSIPSLIILYHKLKVLTQCMCRYHFLLQGDNTDKVDKQIHIVYFGLW